MKRFFILLVFIGLVGCAAKEPLTRIEIVEVKIPIQVKAKAPDILLSPITVRPPVFISPSDPAASSALSSEGEEALKRLLLEYYDREIAWRTWAEN